MSGTVHIPDSAEVREALFDDPRRQPWPTFAAAAAAAVEHLNAVSPMDLWMVTQRVGGDQVVVASAGFWADLASPGTAFPWADSFCLRMVEQRGPMFAPDVALVPNYQELSTGVLARVRSYIGIPLESDTGRLFGTLCAYSGAVQPATLTESLPLAQLLGQFLGTILAREHLILAHRADAAAASELAECDRLTGLRNRRGWEMAVATEQRRVSRRGSATSVLVLDLDDLKSTNDTAGHSAGDDLIVACARVLERYCRACDTSARLGGDEYGVLLSNCDAEAANAILTRLQIALAASGVIASTGSATSTPGEEIAQTWSRADKAMYADKRERGRRRALMN